MPVLDRDRTRTGDRRRVEALRAGDESAFSDLVAEHSPSMLRVATMYVRVPAVAEEVVQETWLAVLEGIERFEGRSSLRTWIFKILTNTAATRGAREHRSVPFSSLADADTAAEGPVVDADRFLPDDHRFAGHWAIGPTAWTTPEDGLLHGETREVIVSALERLPLTQRTVVALRDIYGWPSDEVCDALSISAGNQRVLLHRGRSKVRGALERHLGAVEPTLPEVRI